MEKAFHDPLERVKTIDKAKISDWYLILGFYSRVTMEDTGCGIS